MCAHKNRINERHKKHTNNAAAEESGAERTGVEWSGVSRVFTIHSYYINYTESRMTDIYSNSQSTFGRTNKQSPPYAFCIVNLCSLVLQIAMLFAWMNSEGNIISLLSFFRWFLVAAGFFPFAFCFHLHEFCFSFIKMRSTNAFLYIWFAAATVATQTSNELWNLFDLCL